MTDKEIVERLAKRLGIRTWGRRSDGQWGCDHCCTGDRCDDPTHLSRETCPHCKGTGALRLLFLHSLDALQPVLATLTVDEAGKIFNLITRDLPLNEGFVAEKFMLKCFTIDPAVLARAVAEAIGEQNV